MILKKMGSVTLEPSDLATALLSMNTEETSQFINSLGGKLRDKPCIKRVVENFQEALASVKPRTEGNVRRGNEQSYNLLKQIFITEGAVDSADKDIELKYLKSLTEGQRMNIDIYKNRIDEYEERLSELKSKNEERIQNKKALEVDVKSIASKIKEALSSDSGGVVAMRYPPKLAIDEVTIERLGAALLSCGVMLTKDVLDLIIDLVEAIEGKKGGLTIDEILEIRKDHKGD